MDENREQAMAEMQAELDAIAKKNRDAFDGVHGDDLNKLLGLSKDELDAIVPGVSSSQTYAQLIDVVKTASAKNLSNAALVSRIEALGADAVALAKGAGLAAFG